MTDPKKLANSLGGEFKQLDSRAPEGARQAGSTMTLEATVDATKQQLRQIRPYYESNRDIPELLNPHAQIVLHAMLDCFDKARRVDEGQIKDLIWGFEQGGIPGPLTVGGLVELEKAGYVKFQAPDNTYVDFSSSKIDEAFVRYERKLLDMVYEGSAP